MHRTQNGPKIIYPHKNLVDQAFRGLSESGVQHVGWKTIKTARQLQGLDQYLGYKSC